MKKILLLGLLAATSVGITAQELPAVKKAFVQERESASSSAIRKKSLPSDVIVKSNGNNQLRKAVSNKIQRPLAKAIAKAEAQSDDALYENFGGWDGETAGWLPDGWTLEHKGECDLTDSWNVSAGIRYYPQPVDGNFYIGVFFSDKSQDEWLISPEVSVGENMELSYYILIDPAFLYSMDNIDWTKFDYVGDKVVAYNVQVLAQTEGEDEWKVLRDYADEYKDLSLSELYELSPSELQKNTVSLAEFAGKKIKIAFRYVGMDGDTVFMDAIRIGLPTLENICYINPTNTLYWGFSHDADMTGFEADFAMYPVYAPLTWVNYSEESADFSWTYDDPTTGEKVTTSEDEYELSVTYVPDYSSEETIANNLFEFPTLTATKEGATPTSYTAPCKYFQAGGKSAVQLSPESNLEVSLFPFAVNKQGVTRVTVTDDKLGAYALPVFGYNEFSDAYWLNYSLNGEEANETDYSHLIGIANIFWASSEAPIVVNGMSVYGWGKMAEDVELTATIYALNADLSTEYETFTVVGQAKITGKDILSDALDEQKGYLCLPFKFETPVAVQASEEHPVFLFMLEGFNSDKVEYWNPFVSKVPDEFNMSFGYILNKIDLSSQIGRPAYYSLKSMRYEENGDYETYNGSFAIGLDAEYPWLHTDAEKIEFAANETTATVALGSYYDGSKLTVAAPEGVSAKVEGRYDKCVLTVTREAGAAVEGTITVSGPGVKIELPVVTASGSTGIDNIEVNAEIDAIYDLSGRKVVAPEAGIYVVKYNDGQVRKVTVK